MGNALGTKKLLRPFSLADMVERYVESSAWKIFCDFAVREFSGEFIQVSNLSELISWGRL